MTDWYTANGAASEVTLDTNTFQAGNTPDVLASFSSRGPGVGNVLKPDITAPGVNILAQGYDPLATGEARHLGFGQVSGTSMAAPHVTGSAALLRQIHPTWSNAYIKSALMSTSKYVGIWNDDGSHAQPLDMGAGRLDLTNAADPGVILDPPSVSFGQMVTGTAETLEVTVTSVATGTETYDVSLWMVGGMYPTPTVTAGVPGFSVSPISLTLGAGASGTIEVTFDSTQGSIGDNQGFISLDGSAHDAHLPVWARVALQPVANVLIIDADVSESPLYGDYLAYYTDALDNLGLTYDVLNWTFFFVPEAAVLAGYDAVIIFTGDFYGSGGTFAAIEMDRLTEYANTGKPIFAMGQDLASAMNSTSASSASYFYDSVLGGDYLQDSVTGFDLPSLPVSARNDAPQALQGINIDLSGPSTNQIILTGANETPPVATSVQGTADLSYNSVTGQLDYEITVTTVSPITITASHIHSGTVGVPGPILYPLPVPGAPVLVTDTLTYGGSVVISTTHEAMLLAGDTYINVHTTAHPAGEIRGQVVVTANGDGAGNQYYIDEIGTTPNDEPEPVGNAYPYQALLQYPGPYNVEQGTVAMAHRDQPTLENPGLAYLGRSIYTTFGLEGVNNGGAGNASREALLSAFMDWAMDEPTAVISDVTTVNASNLTQFEATLSSNIAGVTGVTYRWDFGDGTPYTNAFTSSQAGHTYATCGTYTVRVEVTDSWGNQAIGTLEAHVTNCGAHLVYMPLVFKNWTP
jgi:hypothetical protein